MVDHQFADERLAALYDEFHPWDPRGDFGFYLPMVMSAEAVLDVGCGTGMLLHRAREAGHKGRLCGLDPGEGMLRRARVRSDVEWIDGDLSSTAFRGEFDLVVMSGHAFQVFVTDEQLRSSLSAIRDALTGEGRFAFETRNPAARAWEGWTPENASEVIGADGAVVRMSHQVERPVIDDIVRFTTTYSSPGWDADEHSHSSLRFLDVPSLSGFLSEAGLAVEHQYGDWDGRPVTETGIEIITVAKRV
ncbi:methyltransferase [Prauserella marina]|uniref:Methyltransferase domain-containing protein n=1 Tax=Prauserella marina TaxID=530584 RepID=A0A222VUK8_9PSEU|nr:class I SAM-dependent methyltransferase [Prauserella marina]ASR37607.1 methyltransferase [Prauserella marina]PWV75516.1 methyltransferase family protein [Prauserella marina]SDD32836.1 Methyltransferase domain-containing protein [Prauserella marina]